MTRVHQPLEFVSLAVATLGLAFSAGCARVPAPVLQNGAASSAELGVTAARPVAISESAPARRVGDVFVHRFSGSFSAEPLTLTEEVMARAHDAWVVDFALTQSEKVERLRVRFDAGSGRAVSAAHLDGARETPATLADYEALMARTVYAADVNDGLVSSRAETCLVGGSTLECETKTYKVWVGERAATLSVVHTPSFADRDVSGEITTDDGTLVYRAELLEARPGKPTLGVAAR
jgi:hypothetical protein